MPRAVLLLMLGVAGLYAVFQMALRLRPLLVLLLVAWFLSLALEPAVNMLARRGWRRGRATMVVFALVLVVVAGFAALVSSLVVGQMGDLVTGLPRYAAQAVDFVNQRFGTELSADRLASDIAQAPQFQTLTQGLASSALSFGTTLVGLVFAGFTVALFAFYLTADGPRLRRTICSLLPPERQQEVLKVWELAVSMTGGYVYSRLLLALISAVAHTLVLVALGVPNALVLGLWVGVVSQFVSTVGTYLAAVLPLVVALASDPADALWLLAFIAVYQNVENYLLAPRVTAQTLALNPAVAFGSVIAGAALLGAVGALLALPAAAVIQALITAYAHRYEVLADPLTAEDQPAPRPS